MLPQRESEALDRSRQPGTTCRCIVPAWRKEYLCLLPGCAPVGGNSALARVPLAPRLLGSRRTANRLRHQQPPQGGDPTRQWIKCFFSFMVGLSQRREKWIRSIC